jgi:hypothetical protein
MIGEEIAVDAKRAVFDTELIPEEVGEEGEERSV